MVSICITSMKQGQIPKSLVVFAKTSAKCQKAGKLSALGLRHWNGWKISIKHHHARCLGLRDPKQFLGPIPPRIHDPKLLNSSRNSSGHWVGSWPKKDSWCFGSRTEVHGRAGEWSFKPCRISHNYNKMGSSTQPIARMEERRPRLTAPYWTAEKPPGQDEHEDQLEYRLVEVSVQQHFSSYKPTVQKSAIPLAYVKFSQCPAQTQPARNDSKRPTEVCLFPALLPDLAEIILFIPWSRRFCRGWGQLKNRHKTQQEWTTTKWMTI